MSKEVKQGPENFTNVIWNVLSQAIRHFSSNSDLPSENGGPVKFSSIKAIVVSSYEKPWLVHGGVPGECIEGEPGVIGELFKKSVDCGQHLQSVPWQGIPVTTSCDLGERKRYKSLQSG